MAGFALLLLTWCLTLEMWGRPQQIELNLPDASDTVDEIGIPAYAHLWISEDGSFQTGYRAERTPIRAEALNAWIRTVAQTSTVLVLHAAPQARYGVVVDVLDRLDAQDVRLWTFGAATIALHT